MGKVNILCMRTGKRRVFKMNRINRSTYSKGKVVILIIIIILLFIIITYFSSQQGTQSKSTSTKLSVLIAKEWNEIFHLSQTQANQNNLILWLYKPVRKLAHITEYALMSVVTFILVSQFTRSRRKMIFTTILIIACLASLDEIHQLFIPLRGAKVSDVLIDSFGGMVGISFINLIYDIFGTNKKV